jgi:hypothetical protein
MSEFELVINAKTAGQLGVAIPDTWGKRAEVV